LTWCVRLKQRADEFSKTTVPNKRMSNPNTDPNVLAMLEEETGYVNSQKRASYASRVKIPKGHEWRVRFLPVEQGPRKTFWARYAFHWINSRPTLCVRHTARDFGGAGPDAACALCNMSDKLNNDRDDFVSKIGYKASAVTQWLMYCLVNERDDGQSAVKLKEPELWVPWEFWLTRPSFEDLSSSFKKGLEYSAHSFMDLFEGNDFWVSSKKNGLRFSANRPSAVVTNERYEEVTTKIWGNLKIQTFKIPATRDLELAARKLEEYAMTGTSDGGRAGDDRGGRSDRGDSRGRSDDRGRDERGRGDDDRDDRGGRGERDRGEDRGGDERVSRRGDDQERSRHSEDDDRRAGPPHHEDDDIPMGDAPRNERRERDPAPASRQAGPPPAPASPAPPARPSAPAAARQSPAPQPAPAMPNRPAPPPAARNLPPPPASRQAESSVEEDEHVPEERRDPAPPQAPAGDVDDTPPPVDVAGATAASVPPPAAGAPPPPRPPKLSDRLRNGISAADRRG
jgi:hypothetical protein